MEILRYAQDDRYIMSKLIVFDVDGTFLNSQPSYNKATLEYSLAQGLPEPDVQKIWLGYGDPLAHDFGWGVDRTEQVRHLRAASEFYDRQSMSGDPRYIPALYAGVPESFIALKDLGHTLAIITSKPEAPLLHVLDAHKLRRFFATHRTSDDIRRRSEREKPHPDMLHSVMKELKFSPQDTVMIGDTTMDVRMGRSAGAHTIGVTWGAHPKEHLTDAGAHHIVEAKFNNLLHTIHAVFKA
jgi:phosphoglycolate phosphatase